MDTQELKNDIEPITQENDVVTEETTEEVVNKPEAEETLRETLSKAYDKVERSRDEKGKFSKHETLKLSEENKEKAQQKIQGDTKEEIKTEEKPTEITLPRSWAKEKNELWAKLPPEAKEYILKREEDQHALATRFDEDRNVGTAFKKIVDPYYPLIQQHGQNPFGVVQNLLQTQKQLLTGTPEQKSALVRQLIQDYNVDLGTAQSSTPGSANASPDLSSLQSRLQELDNTVRNLPTTLRQQTLQQKVSIEVEQFESKPPPHYAKLKPAMASLLESGLATGLQDAYDKAAKLDPSISTEIALKQKQEEEAQRVEQIKAKTQAAKRASSPIHGSPAAAAANKARDDRPLRDVLSDAYDSVIANKI